jgi:aminopeptidase N
MPHPQGPPPITVDGRRVVTPDVEQIRAALRFDASAREAAGEASVTFRIGDQAGHPALDLRQTIEWVRLDGQDLKPSDVAPLDLGAGPGTEMRVLDVALEARTDHELEIGYRLDTPNAVGAEPIGWTDGGTRFDFWMSDLEPGRYLEMWVPAPLIHDRFSLELTVELSGQDRTHAVIANAPDVDAEPDKGRWTVRYPEHYTALSPMLVLVPSDLLEVRRTSTVLPGRDRPLTVVTAQFRDVDADLAACEADVRAWLTYLSARYGPWTHGDTFWAMLWAPGRGMEYDGATTASVAALEHEVFHSWFGRGVKPARAADGWIDEAFTSWATASRRAEQPRFDVAELTLDEPPVELYPQHPWARHTPVASYAQGSRLFAGLAHRLGGADRLRSAMADWYRANAGELVTTNGLAAHLSAWSGLDIGPMWARYVHGRG